MGLALMLAACGQNVPKADSLEAQSDTAMSVQAYPYAISLLQRAVKYDSNEPRRWVKLGRAQRAAGMPALAAMSFQHALDLDPANVESLQNLAILEVRAGRYDDAKNYVDPLMVLSPDDIAGLLALGAIALYQKQLPQGLVYADKLIKIAPQSLGGYSLKAHILDAMGRPAAAAAVLAQQAVFNPDDKELALQLLQLYQKAGNLQGVRDTALTLARLVPDDPRYQMEAARAKFARGDKEGADAIVNDLIGRYPHLAELMLAAAEYWRTTLPPDAALAKIVDMAIHANGRSQAGLCDLLITTGHAATVLTMLAPLEKANIGTGNAEAAASYANALLVTGKPDRAVAVARNVLAFDSQVDAALVVRAKVYLARKRYADALTDAQLAAAANGNNVEAMLLVPKIYTAWGNPTLAANAWGDASARFPDDPNVLAARMQWLLANNQAQVAEGLASHFARSHPAQSIAWELYRTACTATRNQPCVDEATAELAQLAKKRR
nr:tetratricopeptide repeat protein [Sphingomonas vulcanisoli]